MLEIDMEFRRGILFIRLRGDLTKKTIKKINNEVTTLIKDNEIRNILFNLTQLKKIDGLGVKAILTNYQMCKKNQGQTFLCSGQNIDIERKIIGTKLLKAVVLAPDELSVLAINK